MNRNTIERLTSARFELIQHRAKRRISVWVQWSSGFCGVAMM